MAAHDGGHPRQILLYLQVLNLKSFTAITKQSSWIVHPVKLRSIFCISYEISFIMTAVTDITSFGSHISHTNTFVEKSVSLWIQQRHSRTELLIR